MKAHRHVFVFGSGRSGTTWVQDVLAEANDMGTLFEPLHPEAVPSAVPFAHLYLAANAERPELRAFMDQVLDDRLSSIWIRSRLRPDRMLPTAKDLASLAALKTKLMIYANGAARWRRYRRTADRPKIVKFIRANLMAEWLVGQYGFKAVLIVRHPCAVLSSVQRRTGREWELSSIRKILDRYLQQPDLVRVRLAAHAGRLERMRSLAEIQTAVWCIENAHLLSGHTSIPVVFYEDLIMNADDAWPSLTRAVGLPTVPGPELLAQPSQQASFSAQASPLRQLASWQERLSDDSKRLVSEVLAMFEVRAYDATSPLPVRATLSGRRRVL